MTTSKDTSAEWLIYKGDGGSDTVAIGKRSPPPPWRDYAARRKKSVAQTFQASTADKEMVNAALHLRRPLLITGRPGTGKSSLAKSVAYELGLGNVLTWAINTKSTLQDGLYQYDAVGRLQAAAMTAKASEESGPNGERPKVQSPDISEFLRLGPLGTALLPGERPRVLLIDEIDKSDIDLPNDLLHVFEEGEFEIPELVRISKSRSAVHIREHGSDAHATITDGIVRSAQFPVVFLTSNGERDFPPAFLRRCLHLEMRLPDKTMLEQIVSAHIGAEALAKAEPLIATFLDLRDKKDKLLATDQLLNAVFLVSKLDSALTREKLTELIFSATTSNPR